jgi:hypothetical protein
MPAQASDELASAQAIPDVIKDAIGLLASTKAFQFGVPNPTLASG